MRPDIVNLRQFYSSRLGRKVKRRLRRMLREYWPGDAGLHMVGVGYASPLLPLPTASAHPGTRILALMPIAQGAIYWPVDSANHSVLGDEERPPFAPSSLHRVLMLHGFEHAAAPEELLRIWWQLLAPGGRLVLMVPNRRGLWRRFGETPFATGAAYTPATLRELLNAANFTVRDTRSALFAPPSTHPFWLRGFGLLEWLGVLCTPRWGGVLVVEAEKQIYAGVRATPSTAKVKAQWQTASALVSSRTKV
ncbi:MAG: methyltransferase domain-containing protein [Alphaproteobacteria bacterium]|nr:methyltransferase domain-containing protein [Alphaproteobacteria bacterium]